MFKVNNTDLPTPKNVVYSQNKLWSQNTGRLDNGEFVGDLIAIKKKYEITFPALTPIQIQAVREAVNLQFADVQITNAEGGTDSVRAYFGDLTVESYSWRQGIEYAINAKVSIIER